MGSSSTAGGFVELRQDSGSTGVEIDGDANGNTVGGGGVLNIRQTDGGVGVEIDGDATNADGGGDISVRQVDGGLGVHIDGDESNADGGGELVVYQADGNLGVRLDGDDRGAGAMSLRNIAGSSRIRMYGQQPTGDDLRGAGGQMYLYDSSGTETVEIVAAERSTQGAQIQLRKADGTSTITLDAEYGDHGQIWTGVLTITGGSDLSEQFDIRPAAAAAKVEPGMVVSIDAKRPGQLIVSGKPYDRTVAGVISGAGGVQPGMLMGQRGTKADGKLPVALTGRVYCLADAGDGPIEPGDLLTTSRTPGHARKVTDHARAQGAILGKAMTALDKGEKGLVLVLVTLQ